MVRNMKYRILLGMRLSALLLALCLALSVFTACANSSGDGTDSSDSTSSGGDASTKPAEKMNFAEIDLSPYIALGQYKNVEVTVDEAAYLARLYETLLADGAYYDEVKSGDQTVQLGDIINVDYTGYLHGVAFEGGDADDQNITVYDSGKYIEGFATGFIGAKAGETSRFDVTFPENYSSEELAGQNVTFEFTVNAIYVFDELTDEMASDLSSGQYSTVTEYEDYLRSLVVQEVLWEIILNNATIISYPEEHVQYYYQQTRTYYEYYAEYYNIDYDTFLTYFGFTDASLYAYAQEYTREDLVEYAIRRAENIALTDEEYDEVLQYYINRYKNDYGYTDDEILVNMESIEENMLFDKLQRLLVSWARVTWRGGEVTEIVPEGNGSAEESTEPVTGDNGLESDTSVSS